MTSRSKPVRRRAGSVVSFTGHMIDRVGRVRPDFVPRFPKGKEDAVTRAIRDALERLDARVGFASAACGADLIFIEEMLRRDAEVHIVLPYEENLFISDCVKTPDQSPMEQRFQENPGKEWLPRFRKVRNQVSSATFLGKKRAEDNAIASDCCNRVILGLGLLKAASCPSEFTLLALWDGWSGDAPGGVRSTITLASSLGVPIEYLTELYPRDAKDILRTAAPPPGIGAQPYRSRISQEPPQQICAVLFADVVRFSDLDETKVPRFVSGYLQPLAAMIQQARHGGYGPLDFNTWGDGLFCVFDSMLKAGEFALALQRLTMSGEWRIAGGGERLKVRVALHGGPVYRIPDPVFPKDTFVGTNLNFAARIEPVTEPGEIFCSETFAALAAVEGVQNFVCEGVGKKQLAKEAGIHPLYVLKPRSRPVRK